jgi:hypothetical protein
VSQRPRHGYAADLPHGLPGPLKHTAPEVPAASVHGGTHRARPVSARFEPVSQLKDVKRRFLAYSFPPRSPDPHHLAVLARPGFVRAAPALPAATRTRLPSATATCYDRPQAKVFHLHSNHSASRRKPKVRHSRWKNYSPAQLSRPAETSSSRSCSRSAAWSHRMSLPVGFLVTSRTRSRSAATACRWLMTVTRRPVETWLRSTSSASARIVVSREPKPSSRNNESMRPPLRPASPTRPSTSARLARNVSPPDRVLTSRSVRVRRSMMEPSTRQRERLAHPQPGPDNC